MLLHNGGQIKNRPFSHSKFPCSLRELGKTKSIRTGASGSKCTRCIWTSECVITIRYRLFLAFSTVNCKKTSNQLNYIIVAVLFALPTSVEIDINPSFTVHIKHMYLRFLNATCICCHLFQFKKKHLSHFELQNSAFHFVNEEMSSFLQSI